MRFPVCFVLLLAALTALPGAVFARSLAGDMSGWAVTRAEFKAGVTQITAQPHGDNATSYYVAPAAILGDWSQGDYILFDKKSSGGSYFSGSHGDVGDIVLNGPAGTASYRLPEDHSGNWRPFRVPLDGAGWQISGGAERLGDILNNITGFRIRAEYGVGSDVSALRGVVVILKDPVPEKEKTGTAWKPVGEPVTGGLKTILAVQNGPSRPTMFKLTSPMRLDRISTYHWNRGRGASLGTIGLKTEDGTLLGPWPTTGTDGMGGVANANWHAKPGVVLEPGQYEVIDSNPETWSTNDELGGRGYFTVKLQPVEKAAPPEPPEPAETGQVGGATSVNGKATAPEAEVEDATAGEPDKEAPRIREDLDVSDLVRQLREIIGSDGR